MRTLIQTLVGKTKVQASVGADAFIILSKWNGDPRDGFVQALVLWNFYVAPFFLSQSDLSFVDKDFSDGYDSFSSTFSARSQSPSIHVGVIQKLTLQSLSPYLEEISSGQVPVLNVDYLDSMLTFLSRHDSSKASKIAAAQVRFLVNVFLCGEQEVEKDAIAILSMARSRLISPDAWDVSMNLLPEIVPRGCHPSKVMSSLVLGQAFRGDLPSGVSSLRASKIAGYITAMNPIQAVSLFIHSFFREQT